MGGNAFHERLPDYVFPRLPPALYYELKARLLPQLQHFYEYVTVPAEAPEKADHGDLDFLVASPKMNVFSPQGVWTAASHEDIKEAIGAHSLIPFPGTSNYAVSITKEWQRHGQTHPCATAEQEGLNIACQVDVHVCVDEAEWELIRFMHGYGDIGMILGLLARNVGLSLGTNGFKILVKTADPPFQLTSSVPAIVDFFGLSLATLEQGFVTEQAAFEWIATSRFFSAPRPKDAHSKKRKTNTRPMYSRFVDWAQEQPVPELPLPPADAVVAEALSYFNKKAEYEISIEEYTRKEAKTEARKTLKVVFNGNTVGEWTGLDNRRVKIVMDKIRQEHGGEAGLLGLEQSRIQQLVESAVVQLGYKEPPTVDLQGA